MSEELIKEKISNFVMQKEVTPPAYAAGVFRDFNDVNLILKVIKEMMRGDDFYPFFNSSHFLVFLMNNSKYIPGKAQNLFINGVEEDYEFFEILKAKLLAKNIFLRQQAIDSLSGLAYEDSLAILNEVFDYFLEKDPVSLPVMIKGLIHLTEEIPWDKIDKITGSRNEFVNWSFLGVFDMTNLDYDLSFKYLENLALSTNQSIREEALFRINSLKTEKALLDKGEVQAADLNKKPKITFLELAKSFLEYLGQSKKYDYDQEELKDYGNFYNEESDTLVKKFERYKERNKKKINS